MKTNLGRNQIEDRRVAAKAASIEGLGDKPCGIGEFASSMADDDNRRRGGHFSPMEYLDESCTRECL